MYVGRMYAYTCWVRDIIAIVNAHSGRWRSTANHMCSSDVQFYATSRYQIRMRVAPDTWYTHLEQVGSVSNAGVILPCCLEQLRRDYPMYSCLHSAGESNVVLIGVWWGEESGVRGGRWVIYFGYIFWDELAGKLGLFIWSLHILPVAGGKFLGCIFSAYIVTCIFEEFVPIPMYIAAQADFFGVVLRKFAGEILVLLAGAVTCVNFA